MEFDIGLEAVVVTAVLGVVASILQSLLPDDWLRGPWVARGVAAAGAVIAGVVAVVTAPDFAIASVEDVFEAFVLAGVASQTWYAAVLPRVQAVWGRLFPAST